MTFLAFCIHVVGIIVKPITAISLLYCNFTHSPAMGSVAYFSDVSRFFIVYLVTGCRASVVLWLAISHPRRETPGSIPTNTKKIHDIYGAMREKILCLAAICAAG